MAPLSNFDELNTAWRALTGNQNTDGWRTISLSPVNNIPLLAGRRFPGNEEALLIGFRKVHIPLTINLPEGHGFNVTRIKLGDNIKDYTWIALCRQNNGNLELFSAMVNDVIFTLKAQSMKTENATFQILLARITAWQEFMRRGENGILSSEMEVGLFGELELLKELIINGVDPISTVESWQGPLNGIHDFTLGTGAIEVKTTVVQHTFIATIGTLEQLDDSLVQPLFLAGMRLGLSDSGKTLTQLIDEIRDVMNEKAGDIDLFNSRLLHAGFYDGYADKYVRRFKLLEKNILTVSDIFPRLIHGNVAKEIRSARYEIDIELLSISSIELYDALRKIGVIN